MHSTESAVINAARRCFARYGFRKTSIEDVAGDAGVAKGTVYLYCENKQDLYVRAVESELHEWMAGLGAMIDPARPAIDLLVEMAARDAAFIQSHPLVAALLTGSADDLVPQGREKLAALRDLGRSQVVAVLELGVTQGRFRADLDVDATARVLQEMHLTGAVLAHDTGLTKAEVRRRQAAAMSLVLHGLLEPATSRSKKTPTTRSRP